MHKSFIDSGNIESVLSGARHIFFIGIGGISMSSLAHISKEAGFDVSGSDRNISDITKRLEKHGIKIYYSHRKENIVGADAIVYTAAIADDNPELTAARELGIPLIYRADYLGYIMSRFDKRIGVSGMHGKSTATAMLAHTFLKCGKDPTVVLGAELSELEGGTYRSGSHDCFIMEACEYCDSFLSFDPNIAVVLNIEMDHPDYFKSLGQIITSFGKYLDIASSGTAVVNWDDENVKLAAANYRGTLVKFGKTSDGLDYCPANIEYKSGKACFDVLKRGEKLCRVELSVPGDHNIMNVLASAAVADICHIEPSEIGNALSNFPGIKRRMEYKGRIFDGKAELYDDYAHHPTEIRATLAGAKRLVKDSDGTIWCVFQPHTYSRTNELFDEFAASFDGVKTIFADIYAARETNTSGVSSKMLSDKVDGSVYLDSFEKIADYLRQNVKEGDAVIVMGAGDIIKLDSLLVKKAE